MAMQVCPSARSAVTGERVRASPQRRKVSQSLNHATVNSNAVWRWSASTRSLAAHASSARSISARISSAAPVEQVGRVAADDELRRRAATDRLPRPARMRRLRLLRSGSHAIPRRISARPGATVSGRAGVEVLEVPVAGGIGHRLRRGRPSA